MTMRRRLASAVKRLDHGAARLRGRRTVLIEARTPMNLVVLRPVWRALLEDDRVRVRITSDNLARLCEAFPEARLTALVTAPERAAWMRVDLAMNADIWNPVRLHRCARRVNFPHGVAGKYDLDHPDRLAADLSIYDRIAFANEDRLRRYVSSGRVSPAQAVLVGYPKTDALLDVTEPRAVRSRLGLQPDRPAVLYAPTFSPASSLHRAGEAIVEALVGAGLTVIVKLHDRSLEPDPHFTAGIDWPERFRRFVRPGQFLFATDFDALDYLRAADVMVTDHSSIAFEYCLLDRPIVVFDAPGLIEAARINPEKAAQLRASADVVGEAGQLPGAVAQALEQPLRHAAERRRLAAAHFHQPGRATQAALALVYGLLGLDAPAFTAANERTSAVATWA